MKHGVNSPLGGPEAVGVNHVRPMMLQLIATSDTALEFNPTGHPMPGIYGSPLVGVDRSFKQIAVINH